LPIDRNWNSIVHIQVDKIQEIGHPCGQLLILKSLRESPCLPETLEGKVAPFLGFQRYLYESLDAEEH
jgi:hypothetical protein